MIIRRPSNNLELEQCVNIYVSLNDPSFYKIDKDLCLNNIQDHWNRGNYISIIENEKRIVGFLMASKITKPFSRDKLLYQQFYCSNLKGYSSARAVVLSHQNLIQEGIRHRVSYIESSSGPYDPNLNLVKILEHNGWIRKGCVAKYIL